MSLVKLLERSEDISLSGEDIYQITKGQCLPIPYHKLNEYNNIDEAFDGHLAIALLYETKENHGHWVCLIKRASGIEFYDSYGFAPDSEIKLSPYNLREVEVGGIPHLSALLSKSGLRITYNKEDLQVEKEDVNTCGRYVALRVLFNHLSIPEFNNMLTNNKFGNPDLWVSALTITHSL